MVCVPHCSRASPVGPVVAVLIMDFIPCLLSLSQCSFPCPSSLSFPNKLLTADSASALGEAHAKTIPGSFDFLIFRCLCLTDSVTPVGHHV